MGKFEYYKLVTKEELMEKYKASVREKTEEESGEKVKPHKENWEMADETRKNKKTQIQNNVKKQIITGLLSAFYKLIQILNTRQNKI